MFWLWISILILAFLVEILTVSLVSIWFTVGAFGAVIVEKCGGSNVTQVIVFLLVSAICLLVMMPKIKNRWGKANARTNVNELIGEKALVVTQIDNRLSQGEVKLKGLVYTARTVDDMIVNHDELVIVEKVEGVKLLVSKIE